MPTRTPNFAHFLLFLTLTILSFLLTEAAILAIARGPMLETLQNQRLQILASALTYVITLVAAKFIFPLIWTRSFLDGISWNAAAASPLLALGGLLLGFASQATESLLPIPKDVPFDQFFHSAPIVWSLVLFGTLIAPLFEEIVFRGFLLPAIAIAVDWFRLQRTPEAAEAWRSSASPDLASPDSASLSTFALVIASILSSLAFALIHAPQLGYSWPAVSLLAVVALILAYIRLKTRSVAASTLVHAFYNLSVFVTLFISTGGFSHLEKV